MKIHLKKKRLERHSSKGWYPQDRDDFDGPLWKNPYLWRLWSYCQMKANYKETWVFGNKIEPILLKPGQFISSRDALAVALNCPPTLNLSPRQWWRYLKMIEKLGKVSIRTTSKYSIITIVKRESNQNNKRNLSSSVSSNMSSKCPTDVQQVSTDKNVKNVIRIFNEWLHRKGIWTAFYSHIEESRRREWIDEFLSEHNFGMEADTLYQNIFPVSA